MLFPFGEKVYSYMKKKGEEPICTVWTAESLSPTLFELPESSLSFCLTAHFFLSKKRSS